MESAIYRGTLRHRRFRPSHHEFEYRVFLAFLDIDRIGELMRVSPFISHNKWNWAAFCDGDHFGNPQKSLRSRVLEDSRKCGTTIPDGPIFLLTNLRYLGCYFSPISLFYCYDGSGALHSVLAEVNSTFGESHNYWLTPANALAASHSRRYQCRKQLHVSPFLPMDLEYRFALTEPAETISAHIETLDATRSGGGPALFDATLSLERQDWSAPALHRAMAAHPWMTGKVIAAIHWQALRLFLKKTPFYSHPGKQEVQSNGIEAPR